MGYLVFLIIVIIIIILLNNIRKRGLEESIKQTITVNKARYKISGSRSNFIIEKNNRFIFTIVDGQIVSMKDKEQPRKLLVWR